MFVDHHDSTGLRQGDLIAEVPFPLSRLQTKLKFLGTLKPGAGLELDAESEKIGRSLWLTAQTKVAPSFCAVLSQDCDVAHAQNPPPPSFTMCRLVPVSEGIKKNADLYQKLRENMDPYGVGRPFYQLFYVGSHPRLGENEYVADYGMVMSVAWTDYNALLQKKILEMDDNSRAKFRVKAGAYFGRPTAEEITAGLANPWKAETQFRPTPSIGQRVHRAFQILKGKE